MITAKVMIYMTRTGTATHKITGTSRFTDKNIDKATTKWAKNLIEKYFPDFVIAGSLILICRTHNGYRAARSCTREEIQSGFSFKYLEIVTEEILVAAT